MIPSLVPTFAPTVAPFWASNSPIILGVVIPAVLSFIPIYFSKQICFYALTHWSSTNCHRGLFQITVYSGCKKIFLKDFVEAIESKEKKREIDEKESLTGRKSSALGSSHAMEMTVLDRLREDSSHNNCIVDNPLIQVEEGGSSKRLLGSPSPANSPQFSRTFSKSMMDPLDSQQQLPPRASTSQFRQSNVDIDSDDEHELEDGLQNKMNTKNNNNNNNDLILKSIYSLQFHNPEIDALYQGKLLLIQDNSLNKDLLMNLENIKLSKIEDSKVIVIKETMNDNKPPITAMKSTNGIITNFMEEWTLIRYAVVFFFFPLIETSHAMTGCYPLSIVLSFEKSWLLFIMENNFAILSFYGIAEIINYYFYFPQKLSLFSYPRSLLLLRSSFWKFVFFGIRLFAIDYLYAMRQEWIHSSSLSLSDQSSTSLSWVDLRYCAGLISIYFLQQIGNCFISGEFHDCLQTIFTTSDFYIKAVSSGSGCYYLLHQSANQNTKETLTVPSSRLNSFVPVMINTIVFVSFISFCSLYPQTPMTILSSVVFIDYWTKFILSLVPETWKRSLFGEWYERAVDWLWEGATNGMERMIELDSILRIPF
jgi:hypothetical protein